LAFRIAAAFALTVDEIFHNPHAPETTSSVGQSSLDARAMKGAGR
jgi:DNA-binding XRE family transcriptional regulator